MPIADVNGIGIHYRFDGPEGGEVVLFSNSLASDMTMWESQIAPLSGAGYRLLRYDGRGHGKSSVPAGPYTMETLASDAVALMDRLGISRAHFCGLSLGGMVGQMLGALHGKRLLSLTLCDTSPYIAQRGIWDERIAWVRKAGMASVVDATINRWFTHRGQERLREAVERARNAILSTPVEGYCGCGRAIDAMDLREMIRGISVRTLVVVGELDPGTPVSVAESIHERIASSTLKVIPDAMHMVNVEQAESFNRVLLDFLSGKALS